MKESEIRKDVVHYLRLKKWFVYYNLAGLGAFKGLSDLVAVKKGVVVHIELKTKTGKLSDYQKMFQEVLERAGGIYEVVRTLDDAIALNDKWGGGTE